MCTAPDNDEDPAARHRPWLWLGAALALGLVAFATLHATTAPPNELAPPAARIPAARLAEHARPRRVALRSEVALVVDAAEDVALYEQHANRPRPIASLTKLMTAMLVIDSGQPEEEPITITDADRDRLRGSRSRLAVGSVWTRRDLVIAALGASDNRATAALARTYPGGREAFVQAMNARAAALGMASSRFADASGLSSANVSTARDLVMLARAARRYPLIRHISSMPWQQIVEHRHGAGLAFVNTNRLVRSDDWRIDLSKTGYTADAGNCLLMQATVGGREVVIVLLNSWGALSTYGDSRRLRDWLLRAERQLSASLTAPLPPT